MVPGKSWGVAICCHQMSYSKARMHQIRLRMGVHPRPRWGSLQPTSKGDGSVAEWLACWTQAHKGLGSNRSRDADG